MHVLSLLIVSSTVFAMGDMPEIGRITDKATGNPIANAFVVAKRKGMISMLVDSQTICYHREVTTTDKNGYFHLRAEDTNPKGFSLSRRVISYIIYKKGYETSYPLTKDKISMVLFTGGKRDRLAYLSRIGDAIRCYDQDDISTLPVYEALYNEAATIAEDDEDRFIVITLLRYIEAIKLGERVSWDNWEKRKKKLQCIS